MHGVAYAPRALDAVQARGFGLFDARRQVLDLVFSAVEFRGVYGEAQAQRFAANYEGCERVSVRDEGLFFPGDIGGNALMRENIVFERGVIPF